jgi:hypothetical protein
MKHWRQLWDEGALLVPLAFLIFCLLSGYWTP